VCRDFTINALYYDPATNEVLDFVGGVDDARGRTLRLTDSSPARLFEDPLRILRGVRFATVLGLKLAPDTARAMRAQAHLCSLNAGEGAGGGGWMGGSGWRCSVGAASCTAAWTASQLQSWFVRHGCVYVCTRRQCCQHTHVAR